MHKSIIQFLFLILCCTTLSAQTVRQIKITGCKKTKISHLERFLCVHEGELLDSTNIQQDEQVLRNLNLFSDVTPIVHDTSEGYVIEYQLKEQITLLPIGNIGAAGGNFILQLGVIDYNFMGNGSVASAYYRYYDRHTFHAFLRTPYIKKSKWGYSVNLLKQSTLEPIKFFDVEDMVENTRYKYDLYSLELLARYEFAFRNYIEFGSAALYEKYAPENPEEVISPQAISINTPKFLSKISHIFERVNYFNEYRNGFSNIAYFEVSTAPELEDNIFWKFRNTTAYYKRIGKGGNLAFRLNIGISDNDFTPFPAFVLDNYLNVRGIGDRVLRGSKEVSFNAEYRQMIFEHKIGAIQIVPFVDIGALALSGRSFDTITQQRHQGIFGGLGLRVSVRKFANTILRLDLSANLRDIQHTGFGFGLGQYF